MPNHDIDSWTSINFRLVDVDRIPATPKRGPALDRVKVTGDNRNVMDERLSVGKLHRFAVNECNVHALNAGIFSKSMVDDTSRCIAQRLWIQLESPCPGAIGRLAARF